MDALRKTSRCEADCEPLNGYNDSQTNAVTCGADSAKCPECLCEAGTCAKHMQECPFCDFRACGDCVDSHELTHRPQPIIDALDNPCAPLEAL